MEREVERRMEKEIESLREMDRHFLGRTAGLDRDNNTHFGSSSSSRSKYYNMTKLPYMEVAVPMVI